MKVISTEIPDVLLLEPRVFQDDRGFFLETWNARTFRNEIKLDVQFVQDNHSRSARDVLRGLHYQIRQPQGKLVRVARGQVFDVAVDLRKSSPTFGRWVGHELSEDNHRQLWIPPGFAHGFLVLSEIADVLYKTTDYYAPEHERCLIWNDPEVGIDWPLDREPVLSVQGSIGAFVRQSRGIRVRLLVTGGNGQVGWELRRSLAAIGDVIALDRKACDLSRPHDLPGLIGEVEPDVIVNAAAYTAVDQAEEEEELATLVNGAAVGVLATEARKRGALLIHYSTDYVFDGTKDSPYTEDDPPNPINAYGRSKLAGERASEPIRRRLPDFAYQLGVCGARPQLPANGASVGAGTRRAIHRGRPDRRADLGAPHRRRHGAHHATRLPGAGRGRICVGNSQPDRRRRDQLVRLRGGHSGSGDGPAGRASEQTQDPSDREFGVSSARGKAEELPLGGRTVARTVRDRSPGMATGIGALHAG